MTRIKDALKLGKNHLANSSQTAQLDAELLLGHCIAKSRSYLYTYPEKLVTPQIAQKFKILLDKRLQGVPIAYLINQCQFWSQTLYVNENTLIPRPATELLVEKIIENLGAQADILDIGTGCGAIAQALAAETLSWNIVASDISQGALEVARKNGRNLQNITFIQSDIFANIPARKFDVIVSNPPYIAFDDSDLTLEVKKYEPNAALFSAEDGLSHIRRIISQAREFLKGSGIIILEHGFKQQAVVIKILQAYDFKNIKSYKDFEGLPRACMASI